jgi:hypothetical protein
MAACDNPAGNNNNNNNGNGTVATSFIFRNAATNAAISPSPRNARSVTGPGGVTYEVDDASFADYAWFYNTWLGGDAKKVGTGITPTKFAIPVALLKLYGHGIEAELIGSTWVTDEPVRIVDFGQGVTIELGNIEPGTYNVVEFRFSTLFLYRNDTYYYPEIAFALPAAMNSVDLNDFSFLLRPRVASGEQPPITHTTSGGTKTITAPLAWLSPLYVEPNTSGGGAYEPRINIFDNAFSTLYFYGDKYKLYAQGDFNNNPSPLVTVPFDPIVIPEDATSVTFEIRWDLTNIIQQYTGRKSTGGGNNGSGGVLWEVDSTPNDANDIFVLRNKFWEGFSITATVN